MHDFIFDPHETVLLVWPLSRKAANWLHANAPQDAVFFNGALVLEHRFVGDVMLAVKEAGFTLRAGRYCAPHRTGHHLQLVQ